MSGYRCGRKAQSIKALFRKQQQSYHVGERHKPVADVRRRPRGADGDKRAEKDKKDVNGAVKREKKPEKAAFSAKITQALLAVETPADNSRKREKDQADTKNRAPDVRVLSEKRRQPPRKSVRHEFGGFGSGSVARKRSVRACHENRKTCQKADDMSVEKRSEHRDKSLFVRIFSVRTRYGYRRRSHSRFIGKYPA